MQQICGADCEKCGFGKNTHCKGCKASNGCPFGKPCFIAKYEKVGGKASFEAFKKDLVTKINDLQIPGLPKITELCALNGGYVNLAYPLPSGKTIPFLDDREIYLGTQVENEFNDGTVPRCFGIVANADFILVAEYGINGTDPELICYKKR